MDQNKLTELVLSYVKKEITPEDYQILLQWVQESPSHQQLFNQIVQIYRNSRQIDCWDQIDEKQAWQQISNHLSRPAIKRPHHIRQWLSYAATFILLLSTIITFYFVQNRSTYEQSSIVQIIPGTKKAILYLSDGSQKMLSNDSTQILTEKNGTIIEFTKEHQIAYHSNNQTSDTIVYNTIVVPRGGEYSMILVDGTKVWLNAESELKYPIVFNKEKREVFLKGEAYFEVQKETNRPFLVQSKYNRIEVLGTKFNVSAYENNSSISTTLLQGCVKVSNSHTNCILKPGEQAISNKQNLQIQKVDASIFTSWVKGIFEFEDMPLGEITEQLGRWYDIEFIYADNNFRTINFTGAATRYKDLNFILDMIEQISKVKFTIIGKSILIEKQ
ncbi:MAG: DUF4974 domain-containing protein [Odoribacter sp.]